MPKLIITILSIMCICNSSSAFAAANKNEHILFHPLSTEEEILARKLLHISEQDEIIDKGWLAIPQDLQIAYLDLDNSKDQTVALLMQSTYYCGTAGCEVILWKLQGKNWAEIATGTDYFIKLRSKHNGYYDLSTRDGIMRWNGNRYEER